MLMSVLEVKYINESLLDDVETDEVNDDNFVGECDCEIVFYAGKGVRKIGHEKSFYATNNIFEAVESVLADCKKKNDILCYEKPEFVRNESKTGIRVRFGSIKSCDVDGINAMIARIVKILRKQTDYIWIDDFFELPLSEDIEMLSINKDFYKFYGLKDRSSINHALKNLLKNLIFYRLVRSCGENLYRIRYSDKINLVRKNGSFVLDFWVDFCHVFKYGWCLVEIDDKRNYVDADGNLLLDDWRADSMHEFCEGFAKVRLSDGSWGFMDTSGKIISSGWKDCRYFIEGYAAVKDANGWTYINSSGNEITNERFRLCSKFSEGYGQVVKEMVSDDGHYYDVHNYIDGDGKLLLDEYISHDCSDFSGGYAKTEYKDRYGIKYVNYIKNDGKMLFNEYKRVQYGYSYGNFHEGMAIVKLGAEFVYMNELGLFVSDMFKSCHDFKNGFGVVIEFDDKMNLIKKNGKPLFKKSFDFVGPFDERGYAYVGNWLYEGIVDTEGNEILKCECEKVSFISTEDAVGDYADCVAFFKKDGMYNCILTNGECLFEYSFDKEISLETDGIFRIGDDYFVDRNGTLVSYI